MKKRAIWLILLCFVLAGCGASKESAQVVATTLPVYEFASRICAGTEISVAQLVTENVSCLHDYSLSVSQMQVLEGAQLVVLSGGGLEDFLMDAVAQKTIVDSGEGVALLDCGHEHDHDHDHETDAHIWLSTANAKIMAKNICQGLTEMYPAYGEIFKSNAKTLEDEIDALESYGKQKLSELSSREMITFHDGFSYFAECFDLHVLKAVEEESGSEASAAELIELIELTRDHQLPAVFTEKNGSTSASEILSRETGAKVFALDMAMSGDSWYGAMVHNINTVKEALG